MIDVPLFDGFDWPCFLGVIALCAILTAVLVRCAPSLGLLDDPASAPERKHQARPIPRVGGLVLVLGFATLWFWRRNVSTPAPGLGWACAGMAAAFSAGSVSYTHLTLPTKRIV